jgi:tRNA threonylcarbamoyl adenosine modification protein (Sua5/YciO/YrdC/YwlC family)
MARRLYIHPDNPQERLVSQAVSALRDGGLVVYPTDTTYALGCGIGEKTALDRLIRIRQLDSKHQFTLMCADLSALAGYAKVDNSDYRLLKAHTPGPYTFILQATTEVPRRLLHPKKRTIGIRVSADPICQALLAAYGEPIMTSTLWLPGHEHPEDDPDEAFERLEKQVDVFIDGGFRSLLETTVVSLAEGDGPHLVRAGAGSVESFF